MSHPPPAVPQVDQQRAQEYVRPRGLGMEDTAAAARVARLADLDIEVPEPLTAASVADVRRRYPAGGAGT